MRPKPRRFGTKSDKNNIFWAGQLPVCFCNVLSGPCSDRNSRLEIMFGQDQRILSTIHRATQHVFWSISQRFRNLAPFLLASPAAIYAGRRRFQAPTSSSVGRLVHSPESPWHVQAQRPCAVHRCATAAPWRMAESDSMASTIETSINSSIHVLVVSMCLSIVYVFATGLR